MIFDSFRQHGALNSPPIFHAFEQGLIKLGHTISNQSMNGDAAIIWSVLWHGRMKPNQTVWKHYRSQNKPVIVLEVSCLKRDHTWKIGINGINLGSYIVPPAVDNSRANQLALNLKPWRTQGEHIIICSQHGFSHQWRDQPSMDQWVKGTIDTVRQYTDRPIILRPHPRFTVNTTRLDIKVSKVSFKQDLVNAWAVINWNSNPGVESIIEGIPSFVGPESLASPVANLNLDQINNPAMPDRTQWLNELAWTEWTTEEMANSIPQKLLVDHLQLATITGS
jgi:hypothetical protein